MEPEKDKKREADSESNAPEGWGKPEVSQEQEFLRRIKELDTLIGNNLFLSVDEDGEDIKWINSKEGMAAQEELEKLVAENSGDPRYTKYVTDKRAKMDASAKKIIGKRSSVDKELEEAQRELRKKYKIGEKDDEGELTVSGEIIDPNILAELRKSHEKKAETQIKKPWWKVW